MRAATHPGHADLELAIGELVPDLRVRDLQDRHVEAEHVLQLCLHAIGPGCPVHIVGHRLEGDRIGRAVLDQLPALDAPAAVGEPLLRSLGVGCVRSAVLLDHGIAEDLLVHRGGAGGEQTDVEQRMDLVGVERGVDRMAHVLVVEWRLRRVEDEAL